MKLSTKPISSPGRAEKFPPPLMRFLRTNVGSKSRGRSRSSPMFVRKKNTAIETQEPSSPKVTCMGQVRVRRSSKQASRTRKRTGATASRRCWWIRATLFCHHFRRKPFPDCRPIWRKWVSFFQVGFRRKHRKPEIREDSSKRELKFEEKFEDSEKDDEEEESEEDEVAAKVSISSTYSPPKNALLLTRCRSAPYRSSSLACRFWSSPLRTEETGKEQDEQAQTEKPTSPKNHSFPDQNPRLESEAEIEGSIREKITKSEKNTEKLESGEDEKIIGFVNVHPLILTRCKSEPGRTAEKLDPELNLWKKRRSGTPDSLLPNNM